ncbi:MAG TPA: hypothetical protein H9915_08725 [Candidatus Gemmiger faecigallinarum]|nr:hypothetical protein [Candidatus Gemmiger faecigallinarum]
MRHRKALWGIAAAGAALLALAALAARRRGGRQGRAVPPLPSNPYRRFYTAPRRLEELAPRPPRRM